jgi:hypothetical protein
VSYSKTEEPAGLFVVSKEHYYLLDLLCKKDKRKRLKRDGPKARLMYTYNHTMSPHGHMSYDVISYFSLVLFYPCFDCIKRNQQ